MKKIERPLGLISIVVITTVVMLLVQSMVLGQDQPASQAAAQEFEAAVPARLVDGWEAGVQESVQIAHQTRASSTNSTSFIDLPNATLTVVFPPGHEGDEDLLIVRFFAESVCSGGGVDYCKVRITFTGIEGHPSVGEEFAFDSTNNGAAGTFSWEAHAMERSRCVSTGFPSTVQVQWSTSDPATTFRLDDWSLSVERSHGCG